VNILKNTSRRGNVSGENYNLKEYKFWYLLPLKVQIISNLAIFSQKSAHLDNFQLLKVKIKENSLQFFTHQGNNNLFGRIFTMELIFFGTAISLSLPWRNSLHRASELLTLSSSISLFSLSLSLRERELTL